MVGGAIKAAAESIQTAESKLTAWDEICGDGDCGQTLSAGAAALISELPQYNLEHPAGIARQVRICSLLVRPSVCVAEAMPATFLRMHLG